MIHKKVQNIQSNVPIMEIYHMETINIWYFCIFIEECTVSANTLR